MSSKKLKASVNPDEQMRKESSCPKTSSAGWTRVKVGSIHEKYSRLSLLGTGLFGDVHLALCKTSQRKCAIKSMPHFKNLSNADQTKKLCQIESEINIMKKANTLHHPNLIELLAVLETPKEIFLVMEAMQGGELFDRIVKKHHYRERDAVSVLRSLTLALQALHGHGILHRDLKPENLLYLTRDDDSLLKIIDFGLAKEVGRPDPFEGRVVGTLGYFAPETFLRREYGPQCDVYSLGVVLYILLAGFQPFTGNDHKEVCAKMASGEYELEKWGWEDISAEAKDLVRSMLMPNPKKRCTLEQVLSHSWVEEATHQNKNHNHLHNTLARMRTFNARRKLRSAMRAVICMKRLSRTAAAKTVRQSKRQKLAARKT